jgi:hypothetical protein
MFQDYKARTIYSIWYHRYLFYLVDDRCPGRGVLVTDVSNASRTMLMDLYSLDWDDDILRLTFPADAPTVVLRYFLWINLPLLKVNAIPVCNLGSAGSLGWSNLLIR